HDPMAVRLVLLCRHYRADWDYTPGMLADAEARLERWRSAVALAAGPPAGPLLAEVRARLADALDAPGAVAAGARGAAEALGGGGGDPSAPALLRDRPAALLGAAL